jgi:hypothetical protein
MEASSDALSGLNCTTQLQDLSPRGCCATPVSGLQVVVPRFTSTYCYKKLKFTNRQTTALVPKSLVPVTSHQLIS